MNRRILPSFVALLVMALAVAPAWAQVQNRTIYGIPEGWSVTANGQSVTVSGDSAIVPEGAAVLLIPPVPAKPKVSNVTLEEVIRDPLAVPLTLEALTAGNIQVNINGNLSTGMKYSVNGGAKNLINNPTTIDVAAGDKVQFYGNGTSTQVYGNNPGVRLLGTAQTKVYGNIMSLLDEDNFATLTALPSQGYVFYGLFFNNANLTDASGLLLPATTMTINCYSQMFYGCSSLTAAPALPATTLANNCYSQMFYGCSSLTAAPALPATMLAEGCYASMFQNCSTLTSAPALPATTLANYCYYNMFKGCSNLNSVTCLATSNSASNCTQNWLSGVAATGTFITPPSTNWTTNSSSGIPTGWTRVDPRAIVPLTMEALTAGSIEVNMGSNPLTTGMKYSVNGGAKTLINTTTTIDVAAGDKVQFFGNGTSTQAYGNDPEVKLLGTAQTKVYGNIMSLLDEDNFATLTTLPNQIYVFYGLFYGNANLTDASGLLLPATTLANFCYQAMFYGCSSLTSAPALPAPTLVNNCYQNMFFGCSSLTAAPALPATTLAEACYSYMFRGCSSLTAAPVLPATTLAHYCYYAMFRDCGSLTAAPALPATTLVDNCYRQMFQGCSHLNSVTCLATNLANQCTYNWLDGVAATGTFYANPSTNWTTNSASGIPTGWTRTVLPTVPLTLEALTAGNIQVNMGSGTLSTGMKYSVNGGAKTLINNTTTINVAAGDKVQFYGNGTSTQAYGDSPEVKLLGTAQTKVYGNIMSLLDEDNFATLTALPTQSYVFYGLFYGNANLTDASGLLLPATTLAGSCYRSMFQNCSTLTAAPALPATTLAISCYQNMFNGCSSLTAAPALPATTLANNCYFAMFQNCSTLTAAPALPATTLAISCYQNMFNGCSSLTAAPALPATTLANSCYFAMFYGCSSLTAAPALPATTLANNCYYQMFYGCSSLTAAPVLPATTLVNNCYSQMFQGCSNLNSVTCLATSNSASNCTLNWLDGVAATGTFITPASTNWSTGATGIPSGWTRQNP